MSTPQLQPQHPRPYDCTNGQHHALVSDQAQYAARAAERNSTGQVVSYPRNSAMPSQDPFTYYTAYLDTESALKVHLDDLGQNGDGATQRKLRPEALSMQGSGESHQDKPRPVPYNLAVRFANRSNRAPLATIIEQGSFSTLDSHGSLLSVGRFPSVRTSENISPDRALHVSLRSLDEEALRIIQEEKSQLDHTGLTHQPVDGPILRMHEERPNFPHDNAMASTSIMSNESKTPRLSEVDPGPESTRFTAFLRGVLTTVRSTREKSCSTSSIKPHSPVIPNQPPGTKQKAIIAELKIESIDSPENTGNSPIQKTTMKETPSSPCQATEIKMLSQPSLQLCGSFRACKDFPTLRPSQSVYEPMAVVPSALQLPPPPDRSYLLKDNETPSNACFVRPQPRDGATDNAATTLLSRSRDKVAARYTPDGAGLYHNDEGSIRDYARDSSRNASFCSTISTSYSGTVLGVDLDLQHDFPHSTRRPVTPVWFSHLEKVENDEQPPPPPPSRRQSQLEPARPFRPHSITSSALTSLLSIAATEGIVQQNLNTPQISFYSPSGNLIQSQENALTSTPTSSSRSRPSMYLASAPVIEISGHNKAKFPSARSVLSAVVSLPPARPAPTPLTTPPQSTAPLPESLRHHHNYQRTEKTQIESISSSGPTLIISSDSNVRGCGGLVRPTSLEPHGGVSQTPQKHSRFEHAISRCRVSRGIGSRLFSLLPSWSASRSIRHPEFKDAVTRVGLRKKGMKLQKRRVPRSSTVCEDEGIGSATGHALRICFCQPYDGAGYPTSGLGCGGATAQSRDLQSEAYPPELSTDTPNARILAREGDAGDKERSKGRVRSDSAVSVGIRVGLMRA